MSGGHGTTSPGTGGTGPATAADAALPESVRLGYAKGQHLLMLAFFVGCAVFGLALLRGDGVVPGLFLLLSGLGMGLMMVKRLSNSAPRLVIGRDGLRTADTDLIRWAEVRDEQITHFKKRAYLEFDHPRGHERFNIDYLDRDEDAIRALLEAYRNAFDHSPGRVQHRVLQRGSGSV